MFLLVSLLKIYTEVVLLKHIIYYKFKLVYNYENLKRCLPK
jgi:hypothetical protein